MLLVTMGERHITIHKEKCEQSDFGLCSGRNKYGDLVEGYSTIEGVCRVMTLEFRSER